MIGLRRGSAARAATLRAVVGVLAVLGVLAGCSALAPATQRPTAGAGPPLDAAVASIPHRSVAPMPRARLADHLIPPTNRWFSGLVFGATPQPVYPLPLSFGLTGSGFAFGVPTVTTTANTITGGYLPAITVDNGSASSVVSAYDAASVTLDQTAKNGDRVASVVIAEGSPVVSYTALRDGTVTLGATFGGSGHVHVATVGGARYGVVTDGDLRGAQLKLTTGQTAQLFAVPDGTSPEQFGSHVAPLTGVTVADAVGATTATTTLSYRSTGSTAIAAMPHQLSGLVTPSSCSLGTFPSVYGTLQVCAGPTLSWTSPKVAPASTLDASKLPAADKAELTAQLDRDIQATKPLPTDSYYGGKALFRLANLLMLAHQLGDTGAAQTAQTQLDAALTKWADPTGCTHRTSKCFVYDAKVKGVVGLEASFGSDQFNDHDFHYGYFLYAAGVAAQYEPKLTARIQPVIDLLAADIGTASTSSAFPTRRVFDAYAGHAWASGYAPFADGNNQESSSEAVNAWNGLALWGAATGNQPVTQEATWMLSAEAASAQAYWTDFPTTAGVYTGYQHTVVGINWGGKRDYATWFSADPNAKLGIQLIPMSPVSSYLAGDPARIATNIAGATPNGIDVQFGDYLLMYSALEGRPQAAAALTAARALPATFIDDADSRSYLLAWIMSRS